MYKNREEAGQKLAEKIKDELSGEVLANALILTIPRGGIPIGSVLVKFFNIPMDSLVIKKIPAPDHEEVTIGAVAEGGTVVWNEKLVERLGVSKDYEAEVVKQKVMELDPKKDFFRGGKELLDLRGKVVFLVDDGIATGSTIKTAIAVTRSFAPKEIIVAVPVISRDSLEEIKAKADRVIFLESPEDFFGVSQFYEESFDQLSDEQLKEKYLK